MTAQIRMYTVKPGQMDSFIRAWAEGAVPLRARYGFKVDTAWKIEETNQFAWVTSYDGPLSWQDANDKYYSSPERRALDPDPASFLEKVETHLAEPVGW